MKISVNVTSDFFCPWCRIADARLTQLSGSLPKDIELDVNWLPFELNPDVSDKGMDRKADRSAKFGSWEYSQQLDVHTEQAATVDGLVFKYDAIERVPNTRAVHKLVWLTSQGTPRTAMVRRLFSTYFEEGRDIGDPQVLVDIAKENGMEHEKILRFLRHGVGKNAVMQLEVSARQQHITRVPSFDIAGHRFTGALTIDELSHAIEDAYNCRCSEVDNVK